MKRFKSLALAALFSSTLFLATSERWTARAQIDATPAEDAAVETAPAETERLETERLDAETSVEETDTEEATTTEDASAEDTAAETATAEEVTDSDAAEPRLTETERIRRKLILEADREYEAGNFAAAEALYREAKNQTWLLPFEFSTLPPEPFSDEASLTPAGAVYWREAQAGITNDRPSQALISLELLTSEFPEFVPGVAAHAQFLQNSEQPKEALATLEEALTLYPSNGDLLLTQVDLLMAQEQWIEATIASRQFVALNPDHPQANVQKELAAENLDRFQRETRGKIRNDAIANVFTGVIGYALTGNIYGPFTAANSAIMLLQGENAVGNQYSSAIARQLPMLEHPEALSYVRRLGNHLSQATGRRDLDYEFFVILDPNLNAFALPGGKIFVNAGAILDTDSEAELAGLLAHELSHTVLSHGFQIATQGNLASSIAQYLPYGGLINNIFLSGYSRRMERQADIVGTQILAASGYAADGVYNVMVTLNEQAEGRGGASWLASHPNPEDRVEYLKALVERGGYNRYTYEGIATHEEIQTIVARELAAYEAEQNGNNPESIEETVEDAVEEHTQESGAEEGDLYDAVERFDW